MAENTTKTPTPRLTVAELKGIVDRHIEGVNLRIDELDGLELGRKIPGITREITRLHAKADAIKAEVDRMRTDEDNMFTNERNRAKLEEIINGRLVELSTSLDTKFEEVDKRLNDIEAEQAVMNETLGSHNTRIGVAEAEIVTERNARLGLTNRVFNLENVSKAAAGLALAAFLIVGFVVGLILWLMPPIKVDQMLDDGVTTIPITYTVLHDFGSWFIGAAVGLIVASIIILFAKQKAQYEVTSETHRVQEAPVNVRREASGAPAGYPGTPSRNDNPETAPTKVMQTSGAGSGA